MKILIKPLLVAAALILIACGSLFAQAPNISYANSPASINRSAAVGTAPNPTLNVTNSGGSVTLASYYTASTFAGSTAGTAGTTNATGTAARFSGPNGLTIVGTTLYVADQTNNQIRAITSAGVVSLLAGSTSGTAGRTNATGTSALFSSPRDITTNGTDLFVADYTNNEIRKVTTAGVVTLLAGSTTGASGTTNATGTSARFSGPIGIVYSSSATALYVADYTNNRIRKVTTAGVVTTLAGSSAGLVNATGTSARFNQPTAVAVDASGNVYVADKGNNQIRKVTSAGVVTTLAGNASGTAGSADGTGTAASFNAPTGITVDAAGNIYVYDSGTDLLRHVTTAGVVTTIAGSGSSGFVDGSGINAQFNGAGLITDASNNIFMADFSNNAIRKITAAPSFSISPALPAGLTLNATTGAVTGTATVSTGVTNYTITANNYSGSGNTTLTLNTFSDYTWGGTTNTWGTASNWSPATVPGPYDRMLIGLGTYSLEPIIGTTETIGSILIGTNDNSSVNITVNGTLNVNGDITLQSDAGSSTNNAHVNEFNGSGTVNAVNFKMIANTTGLAASYQLKMNSSVTNFNISGDISLLTTFNSSKANDAKFTVSAGTVTATDFITSNVTGSTSTLEMTGGTLNFTDPTALAGLSGNGTNTISLSSGSTIGYTGSGAQTIYTSTAVTGLPSGISYQNIAFGGSGIKTAPSGNLVVTGNFTNTLANDVSNYLDFTGATVIFNGSTQSLAGGSGNGTDFKNATFSSGGTKTIISGKINIANNGVLTLSGTATLATGGFLTLKSGANSSATVAAIPAGASITGNVNVERYISGDQPYSRGYRLISSPVSVGSGNLVWPNLSYISAKTYTTGTLGATNGFDAVGNPTMYLYRENMAPDYTSFISGNNRGIKKINNGTAYNFDIDGDAGTFNIPAGNGLLLFFRGDKATTLNPTVTSTIAKPTTFTATGYLNQGNIVVKNWFTPLSSNLSYTAGSPVSVRGFNLLGNPYASSIDWDLINLSGTNVGTTIWVYNPTLKVFSTYIQGAGGVGTNTNGGNVADIIPSGQGFYVKTTAASPSLTFLESHKVNTQVAAANIMLAAAPPTTDLKYLRVKITQDADNKDDALIFFRPGTSSDYTVDEDADYLRGNNVVAISTRVNNRSALAINQMPLPAFKENINLNVIVPANGTYQISVPETSNMPPQYDIWIKDWLKKDSVNIKTSPTYSFDAIANDSTTFKRRFSIVVTTDPGSAYYLAEFKGEKQPAAVVLTWKTGNEGSNTQFTIERSNDDGLTYTTLGSFTSNNSGKYSFTDNSPLFSTENLYRLKHVDISGTVAYSGTVPISYSVYNAITKNSIKTYPNPATSTIKLVVAEIRDKNSTAKNYSDYTVTIADSQGTTVKTVNASLPETWEGDISKFAPGVYFIKVFNNNTKTTVGNSKFVKL